MDNLDFLDTPQGVPEPTPVEAEAPAIEQAEGPARGPDGKFIGREAQPEPDIAPEPGPVLQAAPEPQAPQIPPGYVPVAALQELRAKMRQLEQGPPPPAPDQWEDPEGHAAHIHQTYQQQFQAQRVQHSMQLAELRHGKELTEQLHHWAVERCDMDPLFNQRMGTSPDPYEVAMQEWKREQVLEKLQPADIDKLLGLIAAGHSPQAPQAPPAPLVAPPRNPSPPPRSLAAAPNAGGAKPGAQPVGPSVAFDTVFKD
jgi:hypothetical protein